MPSFKEFSRFIFLHGCIVAIGVLLCVTLVIAVDPYRLYGLIDLPGFNRIKPQPERFQEQIKLAGARAVKANVFIAGNSRAEIGFDPEYGELASGGASTYNIALAGTAIQVAEREINYLRSKGQRPLKMLIGVDFLDFLIDPSRKPAERSSRSLYLNDELKWKFDALFSMTSVADALKTVEIQYLNDAQTITERGYNPLREYYKLARSQGYYPLFQQRATEYAKTFVSKPHGLLEQTTGSSADFDALRGILHAATLDQTEVHLIIYPYHAQILAMFEKVGLYPIFQQWKSLVAREVETFREANPNAKITLWDFSGFSSFQCEPIPAPGDSASITRWYWEAGHFKPALGNLILARIFGGATKPLAPDGLGFPLTSRNLVQNQQRIEVERATCMQTNATLFRDASLLISAAEAGRRSYQKVITPSEVLKLN